MMVLHGAFMTIGAMGAVVPELAGTRQVIAAELQGHGHTAEVDRPLSYEQMADDVVALIRHLGIEQADVFGYSMGGGAALQLAMRHPAVVRKLVVASASSTSDGVYPEAWSDIEQITPELFAGTPWKEEYDRVAPNPDAFPTLVEKMKQLDSQPFAWPPDEIRAIAAPTMVVIGDADGTTPEHAVELFRLRGGGVFGDLVGLPSARLAILLGTTHVGLIDRADWLASMIGEFLDAPVPEEGEDECRRPITAVVTAARSASCATWISPLSPANATARSARRRGSGKRSSRPMSSSCCRGKKLYRRTVSAAAPSITSSAVAAASRRSDGVTSKS
jgi:pimeloyl-ACP methyl ester carboxylesterase